MLMISSVMLLGTHTLSAGCTRASCSDIDTDIAEELETEALGLVMLQTMKRSAVDMKNTSSLGCLEIMASVGLSSFTEDMPSRPFNFADLAGSRNAVSNCRLTPLSDRFCLEAQRHEEHTKNHLRDSYEEEDVVCLSPARTGSEHVSQALWAAGQPAFHNHDCTLHDLMSLGARRIIVSIRHPVARVLSGWQRAEKLPASKNIVGWQHKVVQTLGTIDNLIDSIANVSHPQHTIALRGIYGEFGMASFLPMVQYYFGGNVDFDRNVVKFVCTCALDDDLAQVAEYWDVQLAVNLASQQEKNHSSAIRSDSAEVWPSVMSRSTIEWLEHTYEDDVRLYNQECQGHCTR